MHGAMSMDQNHQRPVNGTSPVYSRLLRIGDVIERTALSRSHIYAMVRADTFLAPRRLGAKCSRWIESDIEAWIARAADCDRT